MSMRVKNRSINFNGYARTMMTTTRMASASSQTADSVLGFGINAMGFMGVR